MASDLTELLERVKAATAGDRWIDRDLTEAFYSDIATRERRVVAGGQFAWKHPEYGLVRCEPYTASLDAALALVERVLPGWNCSAILLHEEACEGHVWEPGHVGSDQGKAATPALALLAALLTALAAQGDVGGDHG